MPKAYVQLALRLDTDLADQIDAHVKAMQTLMLPEGYPRSRSHWITNALELMLAFERGEHSELIAPTFMALVDLKDSRAKANAKR